MLFPMMQLFNEELCILMTHGSTVPVVFPENENKKHEHKTNVKLSALFCRNTTEEGRGEGDKNMRLLYREVRLGFKWPTV